MTKTEQKKILYYYGSGMLGAMGLHLFTMDWTVFAALMLIASAIGVYLGYKAGEA